MISTERRTGITECVLAERITRKFAVPHLAVLSSYNQAGINVEMGVGIYSVSLKTDCTTAQQTAQSAGRPLLDHADDRTAMLQTRCVACCMS